MLLLSRFCYEFQRKILGYYIWILLRNRTLIFFWCGKQWHNISQITEFVQTFSFFSDRANFSYFPGNKGGQHAYFFVWVLKLNVHSLSNYLNTNCILRWNKIHIFKNLFIYFWLRWIFVAGHGLFSSWREQGLLFVAVLGLLIAVASLVVEHGL